jgi:DNA-binding XRE family transcriptional regulator
MPTEEEIGPGMKTIRALRAEKGWTQYELALKVGVQPQAVYLWESGRRLPAVPQVRKLGQVFGICSDEIILESSVKKSAGQSSKAGTDPS